MQSTTQEMQPALVEVIRTAKHFSASERLFLAKTLLDSLVLEEKDVMNEQSGDEQEMAEEQAVAREREAFISLHPTLFKNYPGEHVALHHGQLVDHDQDGLALSLRIHKRFPNEFVWIAPVKAQAIEEWVMRSPRFEPLTQSA